MEGEGKRCALLGTREGHPNPSTLGKGGEKCTVKRSHVRYSTASKAVTCGMICAHLFHSQRLPRP